MSLLTDLRFALRLWRRHPTLVVVAGLSLGLGVGATTTMYSVVSKVAHYRLGFKDVDRMVIVSSTDPERGITEQPPTWEIVQALLKNGSSFEAFGLAQLGGAPVTLSGTDETTRVLQMPVDVGALSIVGVEPFLGRTYRPEDFGDLIKQKEARSIVITYETWQRRLGGAKDVIGSSFHVDGEPRTVIGVMPKGFKLIPWEDGIAFWAANDLSRIPQARWMTAIGRPGGDKWTVQEPQPREIVGVVADVAYPSFFTETPAAAYVPFRQHASQYGREDEWIHTRKALVVRAAVDPMTLVHSIEGAVREVDRDQAAHDFMTMDQRVASSPSVTNSRFFASLFTTFGVLAVLLAMVGVYGVMSWVVSQRTSEFGIRMALGARARDVVTMLLAQSLWPILMGLALGAVGGYGLSRALNAMFWQMTSADPVVFSAIAALMLAAALAAAWVPVQRVTRIDPQQALRYE